MFSIFHSSNFQLQPISNYPPLRIPFPNPNAIAKLQHGGVVAFDPEGVEAHTLRERHGLGVGKLAGVKNGAEPQEM